MFGWYLTIIASYTFSGPFPAILKRGIRLSFTYLTGVST